MYYGSGLFLSVTQHKGKYELRSESEHQAKFSSPDSAVALLASSISWLIV